MSPAWSHRIQRAHELLAVPADFGAWPAHAQQELAALQQRTVAASEAFASVMRADLAALEPRLEHERAFLAELRRALAR